MKLENILQENEILEEDQEVVAESAAFVIEELQDMLEDIQDLREMCKKGMFTEDERKEVYNIINELYDSINDEDIDVIAEAVQRQFRRYGDNFLRQYRCTSGPKAGRMVNSPEKCGIRKDPRRVRIGKKASRVKKGIRVRKTKFTKRKTQSKRLSRLNKVLRGDN